MNKKNVPIIGSIIAILIIIAIILAIVFWPKNDNPKDSTDGTKTESTTKDDKEDTAGELEENETPMISVEDGEMFFQIEEPKDDKTDKTDDATGDTAGGPDQTTGDQDQPTDKEETGGYELPFVPYNP